MANSIRTLIAASLLAWTLMLTSSGVVAAEPAAHRVVGVAGCTAASCHGGKSLIGGEATAWLTRDAAHRRAYDILFNETSVRMAKQLGLKSAHTEARCLACHSTESVHADAPKGDRFAFEFGVGCESCHGAAGDWVSRHTDRSWRSLPSDTKSSLGFRDLRSPTARTEACVACHVGSPRATVDHDLIAAGHPRLTFEMAAYHDLLPKHWDAAAERRRDSAQELRLWAIGHGASAKAMSDIAVARAEFAIRGGVTYVTPDLAEFDCYACHHDLAEPTRGRPTLTSPLGSPRWGSWAIAPARVAARQSSLTFGQDGSAADGSLARLLALMQQSQLGTAPAEMLLTTAQQSSRDLAAWSRSIEFAPTDVARSQQLLRRLLADDSAAEWLPNWDGQTQRYLAIVAVNQSLHGLTDRQSFATGSLAEFSKRLRLPFGYATPRDFSSDDLQMLFRELRDDQR